MAQLNFKDLSFKEEKDKIKVLFLKIFYFHIKKEELNKIGEFTIQKNSINFKNTAQKRAERKFYNLLEQGFKLSNSKNFQKNLKNSLNNKHTIYIHQNSGIPLIGNVSFGLVDRNTNIIEVKPITSCNLKCIYCSVDEDKRPIDFVIEKDYLVKEFKKLVKHKDISNIEAHIASQGEPLLYAPLESLIKDIAKLKQVKTISIDTNGVMLTKEKVDSLINAGLTRFNFSINALDDKIAKKIAGTDYSIKHIKEICKYIANKSNLIITPVLIPKINEQEMPKIIELVKQLKADLGIQNFLPYKLGRNPVKPLTFNKFYENLKEWETKYKVKLIKTEKDFNIIKTEPLPKPFRRDQVIEAEIVCLGRLPNEKIAVAKERTISLPNCQKENGKIKIKITRTKHNIFIGSPI